MNVPGNKGGAATRMQVLLEGPIIPTLLRLGVPNILVMLAQTSIGLVETHFVGRLGTESLAGMALVFPIVMLMQMMSSGALGGGVSSAIARARGGGRDQTARDLVSHAVLIALGFALIFMFVLLYFGHHIYVLRGGAGGALAAALTYSNWVFAGAVFVWMFNTLAAVLRGTGNMLLPSIVAVGGLIILVPLSPLLIFGYGRMPGMGIAGGAIAMLLYYVGGSLVFAYHICSDRCPVNPWRRKTSYCKPLFIEILRVALIGMIATVATNLSIATSTALVGRFGSEAIAGFGTAVRLEYLLVPLVFGLGAPLVTIVGACMGAAKYERALRATWSAGLLAFVLTEAVGVLAAVFPDLWIGLFSSDSSTYIYGREYLRTVGPTYGFFGLGLLVYFASQGAGRLAWPAFGTVLRLLIAAGGGWFALIVGGDAVHVFVAQAVAFIAYGTVIVCTVAGGAWFGPLGRPRSVSGLLRKLSERQFISSSGHATPR